jgi:hypothetical protein
MLYSRIPDDRQSKKRPVFLKIKFVLLLQVGKVANADRIP